MSAITSSGSGNWSSTTPGAPWPSGIVPTASDTVTIASGHTVTLDGSYEAGNDTDLTGIQVTGTLKFSRSVNSQLTCKGGITINNGGSLDMGTSGDPIPTGVTATLVLNKSASNAVGKYGAKALVGSKVKMYSGIPRLRNTYSTNVGGISAGATSITVAATPTNWAVGDTLVLMSTDSTAAKSEKVTIGGVSGTTITISATTYAHSQGFYVGNLSSNIIIKPDNSSYGTWFWVATSNTNSAGDIAINHATFQIGGAIAGGDPRRFSCLCFDNTATTRDPFSNDMDGLAFDEYTSGSGGLLSIWGQCSQAYAVSITNAAFYASPTVAGQAIYNASSGSFSMTGFVIYRARVGYYSSWSFGTSGAQLTNGVIGPCTTCVSYDSGTGDTWTSCRFMYSTNVIGFSTTGNHIFDTCIFGQGPGTATVTNMLVPSAAGAVGNFTLYDPLITNTTDVSNQSYLNSNAKLLIANRDQNPTTQQTYTGVALVQRDNTVYKSAAPSLKVSPSSSAYSTTISFYVFAPTSQPVVVSGFWRGDSTFVGGSGTLTISLSGLGITPSTYSRPGSEVADAWNQFVLSGQQTSGTDGMLKVTITITGASGNVYFDDFVSPPASAVNSGAFGYWSNALPVPEIIANYVSASDVWGSLLTNLTTTGSVGKKFAGDNPQKGVAFSFVFPMYDTSGNLATGKTVSAIVSKDEATAAAVGGTITEIQKAGPTGSGMYVFSGTASDFNATRCSFIFSASGCQDQVITIITS